MADLQNGSGFDWVQAMWAAVAAIGAWMGRNAVKIWTDYLDRKREAEKVDYERARKDLIDQMERLERFLAERSTENELLRQEMKLQDQKHDEVEMKRREYYRDILSSYTEVKAELAVLKAQQKKQ